MIVVDTNVIAYLYLNGERSKQSEKLLARDQAWAAPVLWRSEFRNTLALYLRKGLMPLEDALAVMHEAESLMSGGEYEVASASVLSLAGTSECSAYDCEFIALARYLEIPLVTADRRIIRNFPDVASHLDTVTGAIDS